MLDRRRLLTRGAVGLGLAQAGLPIMPGHAAGTAYEEAAAKIRAPLDRAKGIAEIVRYATLAANSHNTQPWRFSVAADAIEILPDLTRRCPAVDPDDHHLFVSLGCAAENAVIAAAAAGFAAEATALPGGEGVRIALVPATARTSPLFEAIPRRQCTRAPYDGSQVSVDDLRRLAGAAEGAGVSVIMITDRRRMESVLDYVVEGNTAQMRDRAFVDELKAWIRFDDRQALATRDGLSARASGNPNVPAWLAKLLFGFVFTEKGENDKYREQLRSAAGVAVILSADNGKAQWIEVGRACQRFALEATALGLKYAFVNQPVENAPLRRQFAGFVEIGKARPDLVIRFGRGAALPYSLRRPVDQVMV